MRSIVFALTFLYLVNVYGQIRASESASNGLRNKRGILTSFLFHLFDHGWFARDEDLEAESKRDYEALNALMLLVGKREKRLDEISKNLSHCKSQAAFT